MLLALGHPARISRKQRLELEPKVVLRTPDQVDWAHVAELLDDDKCVGVNNPQLLADLRGLVAWRLQQETGR